MKIFIKTFFVFLAFSFSLYAQELSIYTEEMPPYNYKKGDKVVGYATKLLEELMKRNNTPIDSAKINIGYWSRGYEAALYNEHSMIYSAARIASREELFQWVGPIDRLKVGVIAKKSKHIKIKDPQDFNNYTIGAMHRTAAEELLRKIGVLEANLDRFSNIKSQLLKLKYDRVDMVAFSYQGMRFKQEELGINPDEYELVYVLKEADLYYAFNKKTDKTLIKKLNNLLKDIKKEQN